MDILCSDSTKNVSKTIKHRTKLLSLINKCLPWNTVLNTVEILNAVEILY